MDLSTYNSFTDSWWPYVIAIVIGTIVFIRTHVGGQVCPSDARITDKIVLITGGTSGLGLEIAKELAKRGAKLILTYRDMAKGKQAVKQIRRLVPYAIIDLREFDISLLKNVRDFVKYLKCYPRIDILINNAGVMFHPYEMSEEGLETHLVINYLGHFLLTHLLLPKLEASENGRIINVSAQAYAAGSINLSDINLKNLGSKQIITAFTQSKLALVLMTRYMSKLLKDTRVTINAVDPGLTRNTKHMDRSNLKTSLPVRLSVWPWMWLFLKSPKQGCQSAVYLAVDPGLNWTTGKFFSNCEAQELAENCKDEKIDEELYKLSCSLVKIEPLTKLL